MFYRVQPKRKGWKQSSAKMQTKKNVAVEEIEKEMLKEIPMKRIADPQQLANVVAFLASPAASYVNGVSLPVDGGRTGAI